MLQPLLLQLLLLLMMLLLQLLLLTRPVLLLLLQMLLLMLLLRFALLEQTADLFAKRSVAPWTLHGDKRNKRCACS